MRKGTEREGGLSIAARAVGGNRVENGPRNAMFCQALVIKAKHRLLSTYQP